MVTHTAALSCHSELKAPCTLRERIELLIDLSLYHQALAELRRWRADTESLYCLGRVLRGWAPHLSHRSRAYDRARASYRDAAALTSEPARRAELLAEIGATYFEEGRLDEAVDAFEHSRALAPWPPAHLGLVAIACARRDRTEIRARCAALVEEIPAWRTSPSTVAALAADPDFAFIRASPLLFRTCLGGSPERLLALDEHYRISALERAVGAATRHSVLRLRGPLAA